MRIAVIGARGFLGRAVADAARRAGHEVAPVLRDTPLPEEAFGAVIDCNGDARRFWAERNPLDSLEANVRSVVRRLLGLDFRIYVFISTIDVYGTAAGDRAATHEEETLVPEAMVTYGFHKYLAELAVRHHAPDWLILRLGTLIGPGLKKNPIFDALAGAPVRQTPDSTLSLVDLDHATRAIQVLLDAGAHGVFNVTASASIRVDDALSRIAAATGRRTEEIAYHPDGLETRYDIAIDRLAPYLTMPDSQTMLDRFLAAAAAAP